MSIFKKNKDVPTIIEIEDLYLRPLPKHIAIIMDGNGRWAKKRGLPRAAGHRAGTDRLSRIVRESTRIGIPYLTVYAFSTENWKRPLDEVNALMGLLIEYVEKELDKLNKNGVRVNLLGIKDKLPSETRCQIERAVEETKNNSKLQLQIALNYGGRSEIVDAVKAITSDYRDNKIKMEDIDESLISKYLYSAGIPDPDLIIRPSGELRLSNFLLWQSAYSELWFDNVNWPDFTEANYRRAIYDFQLRNRRYGALTNE
jgi:undecaprenyl diphosphate synthase